MELGKSDTDFFSKLRLRVAGGADWQNTALSGPPTRHSDVGCAADPARAGDQTGIGWGLSAQARSSAQERSSAGCPLPKASTRDVGHTPNAKNRGLICGFLTTCWFLFFNSVALHSPATVRGLKSS
jgi:hypothetical protein